MRASRAIVLVLFFCSGAAALVYEIAWVRLLSLILGASHQAVSIVLASWMAGLACGAAVFATVRKRIDRPLRVYALLELAIALCAAFLPTVLEILDDLVLGNAAWVRVAVAFGTLCIPTALMGATLPALVELVTRGTDDLRRQLPALYAVNTFGACAGSFLCGFVLLPHLGLMRTEAFAIAVNVIVAIVAFALDRGVAVVSEPSEAPSPVDDGVGALALQLAVLSTFVTGGAALALETLWTRAISVMTGTSTYSFTILLVAFLIGIALGSAARFVAPFERVPVSRQLGVVLVLVGIASAFASQAIPGLPDRVVTWNILLYGGAKGARVATTFLAAFTILLFPAFLFGVAFPMAAQAAATLGLTPRRATARVLVLNTAGAVAGPLLAGYALVPAFGLQRSMLGTSALVLAYGAILLAAERAPTRPVRLLGALAVGAIAFLAAVRVDAWDPRLLGGFQNTLSTRYRLPDGTIDVAARLSSTEMLYYREGRSTIVSVLEVGPTRSIRFDGKIEASDTLADIHHEYMLGHLPVLLHPDPKNVLVVGMGAGLTLGAVVAHPGVAHVRLVEIEPAAIGGSHFFSELNDDPLLDPRVEVTFEDGRHALRAAPDRFDVITSDPIHPWTYGSAYLYTREYFALASAHLAPGGIACQWLPLYELDDADLRSIVASFSQAYTHTTVWQASRDALLIGSDRPIEIDPVALQARLQTPAVRRQLQRIGLVTAEDLLAEIALDEDGVRAWAEGAAINTDDNLRLEFRSPLSIGSSFPRNAALLDEQRATIDAVAPALRTADPERLASIRRAKSITLDVARNEADAALRPELETRLAPLEAYGPARVLLAELLARDAVEKNDGEFASRAIATWPESGEAWLAQAIVEVRTGVSGRESFGIALALHKCRAWAYRQFAVALAESGRFDEAVAAFEALVELRPKEQGARVLLERARRDAASAPRR